MDSCTASSIARRVFPGVGPLLLGAALAGLAGCARAETAADRHVAEMTDAIVRIQREQDKSSDLRRLEADDKPSPGARRRPRPPSSATSAMAAPRVVQLGGDDSIDNDDPEDPTARPEIRVVGTPGAGGSSRSSRRGSIRFDDRRGDGSTAPSTTSADQPSALDPEARRAYDAAIALVNEKKHDRALDSLNAFLVRWPDHPYAENAMYWRGEIFFTRGEYLRAAEQFEAVIARFGAGRKAPDALLKIGMCHDRLGAPSRAAEVWKRLSRDFPESDAARKIPKEPR